MADAAEVQVISACDAVLATYRGPVEPRCGPSRVRMLDAVPTLGPVLLGPGGHGQAPALSVAELREAYATGWVDVDELERLLGDALARNPRDGTARPLTWEGFLARYFTVRYGALLAAVSWLATFLVYAFVH